MARFDLYESPAGAGYVLDVQSDLLTELNTRVVVPLLPLDQAPRPATRLNPVFEIERQPFAMVTQFLAAVPLAELRKPAGSLAAQGHQVIGALDMLFSGF
jgi:toxin CcdB